MINIWFWGLSANTQVRHYFFSGENIKGTTKTHSEHTGNTGQNPALHPVLSVCLLLSSLQQYTAAFLSRHILQHRLHFAGTCVTVRLTAPVVFAIPVHLRFIDNKIFKGQKYSKKKRKTLLKIPVFTVKITNWLLVIFIVDIGNINSCDGYFCV